ncbi:hypothetical protein Ptr902_12233 [Pyrenophora tritici-repentis]|nr:hypothetical protein Ptr902_12233 [Pyrenophora tritici-repentis]
MGSSSWNQLDSSRNPGVHNMYHRFKSSFHFSRMLEAHHYSHDSLAREWRGASQRLLSIQCQLDKLELDVSEAFCPIVCCRVFDFAPDFLRQWNPKRIRAIGVLRGEEKKALARIKTYLAPPGKFYRRRDIKSTVKEEYSENDRFWDMSLDPPAWAVLERSTTITVERHPRRWDDVWNTEDPLEEPEEEDAWTWFLRQQANGHL